MQNEQIAKRIKCLCRENNITAKYFLAKVELNKSVVGELGGGEWREKFNQNSRLFRLLAGLSYRQMQKSKRSS